MLRTLRRASAAVRGAPARRAAAATSASSSGGGGGVAALLSAHKAHPKNNIPESVLAKVGQGLHLSPVHPLGIIKRQIEEYCAAYAAKKQQPAFAVFDDLAPVVRTKQNFDTLLIPPEHVSRRPTDTYYLTDELLLRTHTSAHQNEFISQGVPAFLCTGDVYRRDEIDSSHYPVFHQMEGVRVFAPGAAPDKAAVEADLKELLTGLAVHLFGDVQMRWRDDYFPFTQPSFELDVFYNGDWMEVLGCGVIHDQVMDFAGKPYLEGRGHTGWAFGLGLERLAMVLFAIPDIRLFWTKDERFHSQFASVSASGSASGAGSASGSGAGKSWRQLKFTPYSKFPLCYKDVSFWLPAAPPANSTSPASTANSASGSASGSAPPAAAAAAAAPSTVHPNDVYEVIRSVAGDLVERVVLFDQFTNSKTGRASQAYRVTYRHMDKSLTNAEVDEVQWRVRDELVARLGVVLR